MNAILLWIASVLEKLSTETVVLNTTETKKAETQEDTKVAKAATEKAGAKKGMFWLWMGGAYVLLSMVSLGLSFFSTTIFGMEWSWGLAMFLAIVLYTIASFHTIGPTELGARIFLGRPIDNLSSGFVFVPFGIFELEKAPCVFIQSELPSDPEHIYRGKDKVPDNMFPPIRIPFGVPKKPVDGDGTLADDPYNQRMTQEVVPVITWQIDDFVTFLTIIGGVEQAKRQMEDVSIANLTEAFALVTPAVALKGLVTFSDELKVAIEKATSEWGVSIKSAKIKAINFNHELNESIIGIAQAHVKARAAIITAEGEKEKRRLEGEGAGAAEKAVLAGRTEGLKKMMDDLGLEGHEVLGAETARGITSNPGQKTIIIGKGGIGELAAIAGAVFEETKKP